MTELHPSRWEETRTLLTGLLTWLDATQDWVETTVSGGDTRPQTDQLAPNTGPEVTDSLSPPESELDSETVPPPPDLFSLLAAMTALRQDVKLQTRSARSDREQAAQTLDRLSTVVDNITQSSIPDDSPPDQVAVDALVDLHDALSRAERQARLLMTETVTTLRAWGRESVPLDGQPLLSAAPQPSEPSDRIAAQVPEAQPRRWFKRRRRAPQPPLPSVAGPSKRETSQSTITLHQIGHQADQMADRLEGLGMGYELGLQRLDRLLASCGIEPIDCLGRPVDAEHMEVVQVVSESSEPDGTVVDEVRRGYRRDGQVYRFAQVVAARMSGVDTRAPHSKDANPQQEVD